MPGECEKCGEHCLDCICLDEKTSYFIHKKIYPIYRKYKCYPKELIHAFEFFIETVDNDQSERFLYKQDKEFKDEEGEN